MKPQKSVNKGVRALAAEAGVSPALVTRKLNQGKTREQIIQEANARRAQIAATAPVNTERQHVNEPVPIEDFAAAQRRKESALADLREMELAEKAGRLIDAAEASAAELERITTAKTRLLMIPDDLGERVATESNPIRCREMILTAVRAALEDLAAHA